MTTRMTQAIAELPAAYRAALRLATMGMSPDEIGDALAIEPAAVPPMLELAEAKLVERLTARSTDGHDVARKGWTS